MKNVLVYLGSNTPTCGACTQAARELGEGLARRGLTLVFGGSNKGTMATLADAALLHGGEVIGVTTTSLARKYLYSGMTQTIIMDNLKERKDRMFELADAIVVMPGGCGTWAELFDALERNKLAKSYSHQVKPMIALNLNGYYDGVMSLLQRSIEFGFSKPRLANLLHAAPTVDELFGWLETISSPRPTGE